MIGLRRIFARLRSFITNANVEDELDREIAAHLALLEEDFLRRGMSADEARQAARQAYGSVEKAKQMHRDERSPRWLQQALLSFRFGLRVLLKNRGFSLIILLTLALGIGANTAMFTVDYAIFLAPLPFPHPEQLVTVQSMFQGQPDWVTVGDYLDWKRQNTAFQEMSAWTGGGFNMATGDEPENVHASYVTTDFYRMMGDRFFLGRNFLPEEGAAGKDHVVILTYKMWKRLGANPAILGTSIRLDGAPYTVVGVLAPGARDKGNSVLSVPLVFKPDQLNHDYHWLYVMARLKPGVSLERAQTEISAIVARNAQVYPQASRGWRVTVEPYRGAYVPGSRRSMLWLLLGAVVFVLLIACVNVANLLLAHGITRQKEIAVRRALGASRPAIFSQFLIESLTLAIAGGLLGVGSEFVMLKALRIVMPAHTLPPQADLRLNLPVLFFAIGVSALAGIVFGCAPAWFASRIDPCESMKESNRTGAGAGQNRLRRFLVLGEFAFALTLLAGAGLAMHSFWNLVRADLGLRTDHVLTFVLVAPQTRSKEPERLVSYYHQILESIESVPGVSHATAMSGMPLDVAGFSMPFSIAGAPLDPSRKPGALVQQITPEYFRTFGIRMAQGRMFTEQDNATSAKVAMVNEDFVRHFLRGVDPVGQRIVMRQFIPGVPELGPAVEWQIVGVYRTVRNYGPHGDDAEIDIPFWQSPWDSASIGVRTAEDPESMARSVAAAVHAVDPQIALTEVRTLDQVHDAMFADEKFTMILFLCFGAVALLLAAVGIYGVMAFSVALRSRDMALRMALGAQRYQVVGLVAKEGLLLASAGGFVGLGGALMAARMLRSALYGTGPLDVSVFLIAMAVLLAAALLACLVPAYRAASIDPMDVLRSE